MKKMGYIFLEKKVFLFTELLKKNYDKNVKKSTTKKPEIFLGISLSVDNWNRLK